MNIEHLVERHRVEPEEVEEMFLNGARIEKGRRVYYAAGQTNGGRYLYVVCVLKDDRIRPISARPMDMKERRRYAKDR